MPLLYARVSWLIPAAPSTLARHSATLALATYYQPPQYVRSWQRDIRRSAKIFDRPRHLPAFLHSVHCWALFSNFAPLLELKITY